MINQYNKCSRVLTSPACFLMMMKYHPMGNCCARIRIQENKEAYKEDSRRIQTLINISYIDHATLSKSASVDCRTVSIGTGIHYT